MFSRRQNIHSTVFASCDKIDTTEKISWKQTQLNLCSIFGSQRYSGGHFKDFKASTISIKCNEKLCHTLECKTLNQTNKSPGTVCKTSESLLHGYTFITYSTITIVGQESGRNQWKSHECFNCDETILKRARLYLASLDWMKCQCSYLIQTRCTISTGVRNTTEANLQIKCSNLQFRTELKVAKKFKRRLSNPNPVKQNL